MELKDKRTPTTLNPGSVGRKLLTGAIIGLVVISLFVFSVNDPDPAWGNYWRVRPLIITPIIAAFGMLAFLLKDLVGPKRPVMRLVIFLLSLFGFIVALWLGIVLGLDGTLWN